MKAKKRADKLRRRAIKRLRRELEFWGCPVDDLTDEQIEEGAIAFAVAMSQFGTSCEEASKSFLKLGEALVPYRDFLVCYLEPS